MKKITLVIITMVIVVAILAVMSIPPELAPDRITGYMMTMKKSDLMFVYEVMRYPASGEIIKPEGFNESIKVGIASDTDALNFGRVPGNGSYLKRYVHLNNTKEALKVSLKAYGNITPLIEFDENDFVLHKNESVEIGIVFNTVNAKAYGNYTGEIDIIFKKPQYGFLYSFLGWT